jgi:hypothetical protein
MKRNLAGLIVAMLIEPLCAADWQMEYARLLKQYVTPEGVRYAAWKTNSADVKALQNVVDGIARASVKDRSSQDRLAFYINAYNAWILREALAKYPTRSVKDPLFTFFLTNRIKVAGEQMSFNKLEKDIIRAQFKEPRIHFALNCASRSCPPLQPTPFMGSALESQLDRVARNFVNSPRGVRFGGAQVDLSMIFDWYKEDFDARGGVVSFISAYRATPIPKSARIGYQNYDWTLNAAE